MTTEASQTFRCRPCEVRGDEAEFDTMDDAQDHVRDEHPGERPLTSVIISTEFE